MRGSGCFGRPEMPAESLAMMGKKDRSFAALPPVTLEDLVPADHFYRHLERTLDLSFVRDLVRETYADIGRPSIDPVVFFKLQLVLFFEGLRSERQLMHVVADRLSLRWYLGYDLSEPLPDHSSLTRIRERYGLEVFRRFFERIVERCLAAGLVWGQELFIDATKVAANAALDSLQPRFAVEAHLAQLFTLDRDDAADEGGDADPDGEDGGDGPTQLPVELTEAARSESAQRAATRHDWIGQAGRPNRDKTSGPYRRTADFRVSTTDPDATPMPQRDGHPHLGYQDHYVVDGGKARIILAALVAPAEVQENQPALDLLWRARFRWKLWPRQITGDTKYGTVANITAIERESIRAYVPLSAVGQRAGMFGEQDFVYDAVTDTYRCPGNATLHFLSQCETTRRRVYEASAAVCAICALKSQCTTSRRGRRVGRSLEADALDRVRTYHATEPYAKAMRKRQVWVEPLFAEAKAWHGLRRFRLRGLEKVNSEALLIASGQNLKRLLRHRGWGQRLFPSGASGAVVPALPLRLARTP
jgi:transposase